MKRCLLLALVALAVAACDADSITEGWVESVAERNRRRILEEARAELPLPEGVPLRQVDPAELAPRDGFRAALVDDLVMGGPFAPTDQLFHGLVLGGLEVDRAGRVHVLQPSSHRVRVYAPDGAFLHAFGQPGDGPGDLERPTALTLVGDRIHVRHRRFTASVWTPQGEWITDLPVVPRPPSAGGDDGEEVGEDRESWRPTRVLGLADGSRIVVSRAPASGRRGRVATPWLQVVERVGPGPGGDVQRLLEIPGWALADIAASDRGALYVAMFGHLREEAYLVALAPDGTPRWILVMPWSAEQGPNLQVRLDPAGRLWVFPARPVGPDRRFGPQRVQVFTADAELVGAGWFDRVPVEWHWQVTRGEHVYGARRNPLSREWEVVRYRPEIS